MAKYDPFWLQKEKAKLWARQERALSHILIKRYEGEHYPSGMCGKGWGGNNSPSITQVQFPSVDNLPTCRQCRELFLKSIGVEIDPSNGYPIGHNSVTI